MQGWRKSKGCRLENAAAQIYDKQAFYSLDHIPNADDFFETLKDDFIQGIKDLNLKETSNERRIRKH